MLQADTPDLLAIVRCPSCRQRLASAPPGPDNVERLKCESCGQRWPVRFGIPDFRGLGSADPYLSADEDLRAAARLFERAQAGGFVDALESYYATNQLVPAAQARRFIAGMLAAEDRSRAVLAHWQRLAGSAMAIGSCVDLGCGTGPLLPALQVASAQVLGVDVGLRWLVLAGARLRERGIPVRLVCAGATCVPLGDASVDLVASESLLENAPPAGDVLAESLRVLGPGGRLWLTTANRHSVGPDPHLGIPAGGWLPPAWVGKIADRRGMVRPRRALLTASELQEALARCDLADIRIAPPPVTDAQAQHGSLAIRFAVRTYRAMAGLAAGRRLLTAIGPSLTAVATKRS